MPPDTRTAFITGAGKNIGRAIALDLAGRGCRRGAALVGLREGRCDGGEGEQADGGGQQGFSLDFPPADFVF